MKKILFVTYCNPEKAVRGEDRYTWSILTSLKTDQVFLHVIAYFEPEKERLEEYSKLEKLCDKVTYVNFKYNHILKIGFSKYPAMISNRKSDAMTAAVWDALKNDTYDACFINMFRLSYLIESIKGFDVKKIFISHNVETHLSKSVYKAYRNPIMKLIYYQDYLKTLYYEKKFLPQFDIITTICDVDKDLYHKMFPNKTVVFVPPIIEFYKDFDKNLCHSEDKNIIICGFFKWNPKIINLKKLLGAKNIHELEKRNIRLTIVGQADKKLVNSINARFKTIKMTGTVDSVVPYYEEAQTVIVPEKVGGGFKLKIAEAISLGKPFVAIKGSVTDYSILPNVHYLEGETFEDVISLSIDLLYNTDLQSRLVTMSQDLFKQRYSWQHANEILISLM